MTKFEKNFFLLCDDVIRGENNKLSLIGIFESIYVSELPAVHLKSALVGNFKLIGEIPEEIEINIDLIFGEEQEPIIKVPTVKVQIQPNEDGRHQINFIVQLGNIKFEKTGKYHFDLKFDNKKIAKYDFEVKKA